jgi:archaellum component FlaC
VNDAQTWAVIATFASIFASQHIELRADRRDFRGAFRRIDERFERVDQRFERIDQRFERIDQRLGVIEVTTGRIDERLKGVETRP